MLLLRVMRWAQKDLLDIHSEKEKRSSLLRSVVHIFNFGQKNSGQRFDTKHYPLSLSTGFLPTFLVFYQLWQNGLSTDFLPSFDDFQIFSVLRDFGLFWLLPRKVTIFRDCTGLYSIVQNCTGSYCSNITFSEICGVNYWTVKIWDVENIPPNICKVYKR